MFHLRKWRNSTLLVHLSRQSVSFTHVHLGQLFALRCITALNFDWSLMLSQLAMISVSDKQKDKEWNREKQPVPSEPTKHILAGVSWPMGDDLRLEGVCSTGHWRRDCGGSI